MDDDKKQDAPKTDEQKERATERALEDTFPASDPPASTGTTGPSGDRKPS